MNKAQIRSSRIPASAAPPVSAILQRKCASASAGDAACSQCAQEEKSLQRKSAGIAVPGEVPAIVHDVLRSPGHPLDRETRAFMEPRFGHDFSSVRVHTSAAASESANAVAARAYTAGHHIVFGNAQFAPKTPAGRTLLAHELAHVVQQRSHPSPSGPMKIGAPDDAFEHAADRAAALVTSGGASERPSLGRATHGIQREPDPNKTPPLAGPYTGYRQFPPSPPPPPTPPQAVCWKNEACKNPIPGSSWDFAHRVREQQVQTEKELKADPKAAAAAGKVRPAAALKEFAKKVEPKMLDDVKDVIVNPAIGNSAGGQAANCDVAKTGEQPFDCIHVPNQLEVEAEQFKKDSAKTIGARSRAEWEAFAWSTLKHESQHITFTAHTPVTAGTTKDVQSVYRYSPNIFLYELSEMNSQLSEYPINYRLFASTTKTVEEKQTAARKWIVDYLIMNGDEDFRGMLKKMRCVSPCADVDDRVKKMFDMQSKGWDADAKTLIVDELSDAKHGLNWPK